MRIEDTPADRTFITRELQRKLVCRWCAVPQVHKRTVGAHSAMKTQSISPFRASLFTGSVGGRSQEGIIQLVGLTNAGCDTICTKEIERICALQEAAAESKPQTPGRLKPKSHIK